MSAQVRESREVSPRAPCPCGSGKSYGRCCKRRDFSWVGNNETGFSKSIKLVPEAVKIFEKQREDFRDIFGRKPRKYERMFYQSHYLSEKDLRRQTLQSMRSAGIRPVLIYAYQKTERIVANRNLLTPEEQREWDEAVDEFYDRVDAGEDPDEIVNDDGLVEFLREFVKENQIVLGAFVHNHFNRYRHRLGADRDVETVAAFSTVNFARCLKSIHILLENDVGFDAYHLLRVLYENYITVAYVYAFPSEARAFAAQLGTLLGTHALATNKAGVQMQSRIVEIKTGEVVEIPTRWRMASSLGAFGVEAYNEIYRSLSSYSHSEITNIQHFIVDGGFDYQSPDFSLNVAAICHLLTTMFSDVLRMYSPCAKYLRGDLSIISQRSVFSLAAVKSALLSSEADLPRIFERAVDHVSSNNPALRLIYDGAMADFASR